MIDTKTANKLVEGTIRTLHLNPERKEIRIGIVVTNAKNQAFSLVAEGVDDFLMSESRLSNIIDRIHIYNASSISNNEMAVKRKLFFLLREKSPSPEDYEWEVLNSKLNKIENKEYEFIELEPVHGASIFILAKTINITRKE